MTEKIDRQFRSEIPIVGCCDHRAHVVAYSRHTQQTALSGENLDYFGESEPLALLEKQKQARIHIATPCTHHQTFQRCEPHGGVYALAILDRRCAAPISEMG